MNRRVSSSCFAVILAIAGSACFCACSSPNSSTGVGNPGLTSEEQALVDDGNDAQDSGSTASTLQALPTYALTKATHITDPATAAGFATLSADVAVVPPGCKTVTHTAGSADVKYVFNDCTGTFGILHLSGTIDVTFQSPADGSGIDFVVTSEPDLTLNGFPVTQSATGNLKIDAAGNKTLTWNGDYKSKTLRGYDIDHKATYTIVADVGTSCVHIDGMSDSTITKPDGAHGFTATVKNYEHCGKRVQCPESNGDVTLETHDHAIKLDVLFLGGNAAQVTVTTRKSLVVDLALKCTA